MVNGAKLGIKRSIEVTIDLSKLADCSLPTELDPKEPAKGPLNKGGESFLIPVESKVQHEQWARTFSSRKAKTGV